MKYSILLLLASLTACTPQPEAIDYGADACTYCQMTIVDRQHGAEIVTSKGRVYKFDAIECMVYYLKQTDADAVALRLVNDFEHPGTLIPVESATFLISRAIPSPMGAFLSAFGDATTAAETHKKREGRLYSWNELNALHAEKGTLGLTE